MGYFPVLIPAFAIVSTGLGFLGVFASNQGYSPQSIYWGRLLSLSVFLILSISCFIMVFTWPRGVVPSCLGMAALFLAMLWQPASRADEQQALT
ncbi:MAG: hypothetical protein JNJ77_02735 [Planctomycetia bacterium]|nr:hypothetical protein [Planctomycetia bacterium]